MTYRDIVDSVLRDNAHTLIIFEDSIKNTQDYIDILVDIHSEVLRYRNKKYGHPLFTIKTRPFLSILPDVNKSGYILFLAEHEVNICRGMNIRRVYLPDTMDDKDADGLLPVYGPGKIYRYNIVEDKEMKRCRLVV